MDSEFGRAKAVRQDGDSPDVIQEAIDTCPVDCIHWVEFEELEGLQEQLDSMELQNLGGISSSSPKRLKPRAR